MSLIAYAASLASTAWRVCVLIFLRILPTTLCKKILPPLWILYMTLWFFSPVAEKSSPLKSESDEKKPLPALPPPKSEFPLTAIILSLPTKSRTLQNLNFIVNALLLLAATEFVFYPFYDDAADVTFTRVGAVYPDAAKIVVRYPINTPNVTDNLVQVSWRQVPNGFEGQWQDGPVLSLASERDWVDTAKLDGLWPSTTYEYRLKNTTDVLPYPEHPIRFKTFPDPRLPTGSHFRFLVSSCTTPNFPYSPLQGRRIKGFDLLADYVWPAASPVAQPSSTAAASGPEAAATPNVTEEASSPEAAAEPVILPSASASSVAPAAPRPPVEFMMFLGDFIYADVPFYFGDNQNMYRQFYRRNYQSPSFRKVYERLPMFHTYDDHDIKNNYVGLGNDSNPPFQNASNAYRLYNHDANYDGNLNDTHYYEFRYGDVAFFVMDTRRYRSGPHDDVSSRTMLGDKQLSALHSWLGRVNGTATFKFIVSSVPFTSLWQMDAQIDSWAAYAHEKAALLDVLHTVPNVVVLSGDRHEFAAIEFMGPGRAHRVLEVSTSPLSMFWIPLVRTLKLESNETVLHSRVNTSADPLQEKAMILEEVPREKVLKYVPEGNYKFSAIEVDTRDLKHPVVHLELVVDGKPTYNLAIQGEPVSLQTPTTALGITVPQTFKGVLDKLGLLPTRWF
ncbi:hypothetical protein EIP91_012155 [Steccherinum ochraceum]|uniref:PhoD-like phosphatase metallophosphatase domain-containing protein n=1 Tax=Steccherinum ochraceum TaxID=92696 RepID=A0A4R0RNM2_9APHY|nr:hypothetical protein EIP91_012155 [Steccherinum ochraceum]